MELRCIIFGRAGSDMRWERASVILQKMADIQPPDSFRPSIEMLLKLVCFLENDATRATLNAMVFEWYRPPAVQLYRRNTASIKVWCDYYDFAHARGKPDGLHYRLAILREGSKLSRDLRTDDAETVAQQIRITFGLRKPDADCEPPKDS